MSRPSDWWVLDLGSDPVPGDQWEVRSMGRRWSDLADDAEYAESRVRSLMGDGAVSAWVGEAGEAFRSKVGELPEQLRQCKDSYRLASDALGWWADRLDQHQGDADKALVDGRAARIDLEAAQAQSASASSGVESAAGSGVLTDSSLSPTPGQVQDAQDRLRSARSAATAANAAVANAQGRLDAARQMALDAAGLRDGDARAAADRIHEASDAGIPERSRWDKFKDWAGEAWDVIITIAKVVVAVLGVVALIIGGPLAWVVFAAALLLLADSIMKYMNGEGSLWEVGLAALGAIPGVRGLTTLAALKTAFKAGGTLRALAHIGSSAKTAIVSMASSVRAMSGAARTTVARLGNQVSMRVQYSASLLRGFRAMVKSDFGLMGSLRRLPDLAAVPMPRNGMPVHRIYGPQLDGNGLPLFKPGKDYPYGSTPGGASWTPTDPHLADNFRVQAGLPDQNPGSFGITGDVVDASQISEVRLALPLDGNPGGWPEYIINNADDAVDATSVVGVNEPWTSSPGSFVPRPGD